MEFAVACDEEQALDITKAESTGILITDIRVPDIYEIELIQRVQKSTDKVPIIISTGYQVTVFLQSLSKLDLKS